ncbi:hypothetical protein [Gloeobacter violaceus]|uniref:hypothetical protein n=1 Tax=Gloeobacter violaceus TaxID=33072 RepID=UPI0013E8D43B|nr:hypothetical protein [Gloeobacter violaceus]
MLSASESIDPIGRALMGDFWRIVYLTIQDAIALSVLLRIPGLIVEWIIGRSFASFDVCLDENPLGPAFYACFIIVISDFLLWALLAVRIIVRFVKDLRDS